MPMPAEAPGPGDLADPGPLGALAALVLLAGVWGAGRLPPSVVLSLALLFHHHALPMPGMDPAPGPLCCLLAQAPDTPGPAPVAPRARAWTLPAPTRPGPPPVRVDRKAGSRAPPPGADLSAPGRLAACTSSRNNL